MDAAAAYAARIDAVNAQRARLQGDRDAIGGWDALARRFRMDPRRPLDPNLAAIAAYVRADDVVVDVGGGAGRVCLPLALGCREVINVDPSPAMQAEFSAAAAEAGITNARFVASDWQAADGITGDVVLCMNVTHFVRDIVPFVAKLHAAARRRVIIGVWSVPPPAMDGALFRLVYGEDEVMPPGHRELLPVLWEMGLLPDVRVLPSPMREGGGIPRTREEAMAWALLRLRGGDEARARAVVEAHFDELFTRDESGFRPTWRPPARELLLTWETA
jgi:SAM-dependent methyltransferase